MTCVVCVDLVATHIVLPCAHMCLCGECAKLIRNKTCPMCRSDVADIKKVFTVAVVDEKRVDMHDVDVAVHRGSNVVDEEASLRRPSEMFHAAVKAYCAGAAMLDCAKDLVEELPGCRAALHDRKAPLPQCAFETDSSGEFIPGGLLILRQPFPRSYGI